MGVSFQYSHTIGRSESNGSGFHNPVAVARGPGDRLYILNRGMEPEPNGKRITVCTMEEEYLGEFGRGIIASGETDAVASLGPLL